MSRIWGGLQRLLPVERAPSDAAFAARHRLVLCVVAAHLPVLLGIGVVGGEPPAHLAAELALLGGLGLAASSGRLDRRARMGLATTALVGCSALLVHTTGGLTESHFHFFAVVAFVTLYRSWLPFLLCIGWVVVHHGVVGVLAPERVYAHAAGIERPALWALIHGGFVVLASLASLAAWRATELERLRAESILAAAPRPIYGLDADGALTFANAATAELLGTSRAALLGRSAHDLLHPISQDCQLCRMLAAAEGHHLDQVDLRHPDGSLYPAEVIMRPIIEGGQRVGVVVTHWDISDQLAHRRDLERLALHDTLTGLANRSLLRDRLTQALRSAAVTGERVVVAFIDLDRFKPVNDVLGHGAGDQLLVALAQRLQAAVGERDTVARVGGDEFVVVVPGVADEIAAQAVGERLTTAVNHPITVGRRELLLSAAVGLRLSEPGEHDADRLVADADLAMFAAKATAPGEVARYHAGMREAAGTQLALGAELQRALENDELRLHYQPIWRVGTLAPDGVEALVRWQHPVHGLLAPDRFVPVAEHTGMIGALGHWVLRNAVDQLAAWRRTWGEPVAHLHVAVNLSVRQLQDPGFVDQVADTLARAGVPADRLWLEVTESMVVQEGDRAAGVLQRLRELGVNLAIDDFGTGYSSLAALQRLPVQQVKIDRSFVRNLGTDEERMQVVRAIVRLAEALDLDVVAEGVETDGELRAVSQLACAHAQGFLLAKPLPADDVAELLRPAHAATSPTPMAV